MKMKTKIILFIGVLAAAVLVFLVQYEFQLNTSIEIQAEDSVVWDNLTDLQAYPTWNPFILQASGTLTPGGELKITLQGCDSDPMSFQPTLLEVRENRELRWKGKLLLPGIFDGEHIFQIIPQAGGGVLFVQQENFRGFLVWFMRGMLEDSTRCGFTSMNQALKTLSEG